MNSIKRDITENGLSVKEAQYRTLWRRLDLKHQTHNYNSEKRC